MARVIQVPKTGSGSHAEEENYKCGVCIDDRREYSATSRHYLYIFKPSSCFGVGEGPKTSQRSAQSNVE